MSPEQFVYWLQGFAEVHGSAPTTQEWTVIKDHLATVFNKVTPNRSPYPVGPYVTPPNHWTTPPNWTRPEITCSTQQEPMPTNLRAGSYCYSNTINAAGGSGFSGTEIKL